MMHSVIRRSPSITSSTVADPSTVTVRIQSASTSDLNVQDVLTSSSDEDDDADDLRQKHESRHTAERVRARPSSGTLRQHPLILGTSQNHTSQQRMGRVSADVASSMRLPPTRPTTAVSLPANPSAFDNEWDLDSARTLISTSQRRNPSYPSISPVNLRSKPPPQPLVATHQVPTVFTTTAECLGKEFRPQTHRDASRRSQSLNKSNIINHNPASPTTPIVPLTQDILLGSIRALQNERQLCKYSVDYFVDATNMRPNEIARKANTGARLPCHCGHTHSRCTLTLEFDQPYMPSSASTLSISSDSNSLNNSKMRELSRTQLGQLFSAANHFISKAQHEGKRILIYGFELTPNSPLAVLAIQYLMLTEEQLSLTEATNRVHRLFPVIPLQHQQYPIMEKRFQDYLKQLDRRTFPRHFTNNGISAEGSSSGNDNRPSPRELSWESSEMTTSTTVTNSTPVTSWTTVPMPIANRGTEASHSLSVARSAWDS